MMVFGTSSYIISDMCYKLYDKSLVQDAAIATLRLETLRETVCDAIIANGAV